MKNHTVLAWLCGRLYIEVLCVTYGCVLLFLTDAFGLLIMSEEPDAAVGGEWMLHVGWT